MKNDKKTILGWCLYDWANSAYITTTVVALLPVYFAEAIVGEDGVNIAGHNVSSETLWAWMLAASAFLVFLFAPVLGAIADFSSAKKRFLLGFAYMGSFFATLLYFCKTGDVVLTVCLFIGSQVCFVGANVFYDAFLPHIASEDKLDAVSANGYAFGYIGGGTQFAISLALVAMHETLGMSQAMAARIGMAMAGLWWAGWTLLTAKYLKEEKTPHALPENGPDSLKVKGYLALGIRRTLATAKKVGRFKHLTLFLIAYMIYNDGIHTVTSMATIYGKETLELSTTVLLVTLLVIQIIAIGGALLFSRLAERIGTKHAIIFALLLWSAVVTYGYFIDGAMQYFLLGVVVGIVLGGTQALSRSFYGRIVPEQASAEFYGFYSVFNKFSAIWGPFVFGFIRHITGDARQAIISLIVFFIVGLVLLRFVDEEKAKIDKQRFEWENQ